MVSSTDPAAMPYTLIDVREDWECEGGMIPTAHQVKLDDLPSALQMTQADFTRVYGFDKPDMDAPLIFYCRVGKRSAVAQYIARKLGYTDVRNYVGSWLEWAEEGAQ
ncbi:MAG: hypothetical protein SGCHY_000785 [Lobulomycetales sp.]